VNDVRCFDLMKRSRVIAMVISMVAICKISKDGYLVKIKEVSDKYRYIPYTGDEE